MPTDSQFQTASARRVSQCGLVRAALVFGVFLTPGWAGRANAQPAPAAPAQKVAVTDALVIHLQPLRPAVQTGQLGPSLRPLALAHSKGQFAKACQAAARLWLLRMQQASQVFYAVERSTAQAEAVERYLAKHVYGPDATLTLQAEAFVPLPSFRQLAADSCARAGQPKAAVPLLAAAGSVQGDPASRLALAALLAGAERDWQVGLAVLQGDRSAPRAVLLAALADRSKTPAEWLAGLQGAALRPDEQAALAAVLAALRAAGRLP